MKILKVLLISLILCMVTGCSVDYTLNFKDNHFSENISIDAADSNMTQDEIKKFINEYLHNEQNADNLYDVKIKNKNIKLAKNYNTLTYKNSPLLNQCYTAYNFIDNGNYYDLTTSNTFTCNPFDYMFIDEIKIKIKTNHKVISHNADVVEGNTYIWKITAENAEDKPIQIRFSKDKKENIILLIILGITVIIAISILLFIFIKGKKNNKI